MTATPSQAMEGAPAAVRSGGAPPRQRPYEQALMRGLDGLHARPPEDGRLAALGVTRQAQDLCLPALNRTLRLDVAARRVAVDDLGPARPEWAVLAVHYLSASDCAPDPRPVSFSYFQDCRSYLSVFGKRIVARFLATVGRTATGFAEAAARCGGVRQEGAGSGFRFDIFPRVPVTLVRYDGDDEIPPGASVIYRADAERLLPAEDRVVAAELLLDALAGKPMHGERRHT